MPRRRVTGQRVSSGILHRSFRKAASQYSLQARQPPTCTQSRHYTHTSQPALHTLCRHTPQIPLTLTLSKHYKHRTQEILLTRPHSADTHTHTANTPPHQPTLISNRIHTHPPLTPHTHTSPGTHTSIHTRHHTHPQQIPHTRPPIRTCCHIHWSWWPRTCCDRRELRSPPAHTHTHEAALHPHHLPDAITNHKEEIPLLLGRGPRASAQLCHCRDRDLDHPFLN